MQMIVRAADCIVFKVSSETLEPVSLSYFDPDCFNKPDPRVWYMSYSEWSSVMDRDRPPEQAPSQVISFVSRRTGNATPLFVHR